MQIHQHLIQGVPFLNSPHQEDRPKEAEINLLVIHGISLPAGQFGGSYIEALFMGHLDCTAHPSFAPLEGLRVSAHCVIYRDGRVQQFVPFNRRAWHAGASCWDNQSNCNDFSIGIELEGTDNEAYTETQYQQLVKITQALMVKYPALTANRIVGHEHIAPGRKTDPGPAFDWDKYLNVFIK